MLLYSVIFKVRRSILSKALFNVLQQNMHTRGQLLNYGFIMDLKINFVLNQFSKAQSWMKLRTFQRVAQFDYREGLSYILIPSIVSSLLFAQLLFQKLQPVFLVLPPRYMQCHSPNFSTIQLIMISYMNGWQNQCIHHILTV